MSESFFTPSDDIERATFGEQCDILSVYAQLPPELQTPEGLWVAVDDRWRQKLVYEGDIGRPVTPAELFDWVNRQTHDMQRITVGWQEYARKTALVGESFARIAVPNIFGRGIKLTTAIDSILTANDMRLSTEHLYVGITQSLVNPMAESLARAAASVRINSDFVLESMNSITHNAAILAVQAAGAQAAQIVQSFAQITLSAARIATPAYDWTTALAEWHREAYEPLLRWCERMDEACDVLGVDSDRPETWAPYEGMSTEEFFQEARIAQEIRKLMENGGVRPETIYRLALRSGQRLLLPGAKTPGRSAEGRYDTAFYRWYIEKRCSQREAFELMLAEENITCFGESDRKAQWESCQKALRRRRQKYEQNGHLH